MDNENTTQIQKSIVIDRDLRTVYNQWTQFEEFPQFMEGVEKVVQTDDTHLRWTTEIGLVSREFDTVIDEQIPDQIISWRADGEVTHAGKVTFASKDATKTEVEVTMVWEPDSIAEKIADWTNLADKRVEGDLARFKEFIEGRLIETGGHREMH